MDSGTLSTGPRGPTSLDMLLFVSEQIENSSGSEGTDTKAPTRKRGAPAPAAAAAGGAEAAGAKKKARPSPSLGALLDAGQPIALPIPSPSAMLLLGGGGASPSPSDTGSVTTLVPSRPAARVVPTPVAELVPVEQRVCDHCGRSDTPEWRRGPNGPRTLCNACGLRFAKRRRRSTFKTPFRSAMQQQEVRRPVANDRSGSYIFVDRFMAAGAKR